MNCSVCLNNTANTELECCKQKLCNNCYQQWMARSLNCPYCRHKYEYEGVYKFNYFKLFKVFRMFLGRLYEKGKEKYQALSPNKKILINIYLLSHLIFAAVSNYIWFIKMSYPEKWSLYHFVEIPLAFMLGNLNLIMVSFIFLAFIYGLFWSVIEIINAIKTFLWELAIVFGLIIFLLSDLGKHLLHGFFWEKKGGHYKMKKNS